MMINSRFGLQYFDPEPLPLTVSLQGEADAQQPDSSGVSPVTSNISGLAQSPTSDLDPSVFFALLQEVTFPNDTLGDISIGADQNSGNGRGGGPGYDFALSFNLSNGFGQAGQASQAWQSNRTGLTPSQLADVTSRLSAAGVRYEVQSGNRVYSSSAGGYIVPSSTGLGSPLGGSLGSGPSDPNTIVVTGTRNTYPQLGIVQTNPFATDPGPSSSSLIPASWSLPTWLTNILPSKAWIQYVPGLLSHVAKYHFGEDFTSKSVFRPGFQNEQSILTLAVFAANNAPLRPTSIEGIYTYTANYSSTVGYLAGSGTPTSLVTLAVRDTGTRDESGRQVYVPVSLYPGGRI